VNRSQPETFVERARSSRLCASHTSEIVHSRFITEYSMSLYMYIPHFITKYDPSYLLYSLREQKVELQQEY